MSSSICTPATSNFRLVRGRRAAALALAAALPLLSGAVPANYFNTRLLDVHNHERTAKGLPPLAWDSTLARDAAVWARHLSGSGQFVHSTDDPDDPDPEGENLWMGTAGAYSADDMVGLWLAERKNYRPGPVPDNSASGNFEDVGHYTQVMWRKTARVGCALAPGDEDDVLVCRYSSGGNVVGERPF